MAAARRKLDLAHRAHDVPLAAKLDRRRLAARLAQLKPLVDAPPRNAKVTGYQPAGDGVELSVQPAEDGVELDIEATVATAYAQGRVPAPEAVPVQVRRTPAAVTAEDLPSGRMALLAQHATDMYRHYGSPLRENRRHNVELCLERFNGTTLAPGEQFSFNGTIGERKRSDGFKNSIIFIRKPDGTIDEQMDTGGGICQLATTLFVAAVGADLKITERANHSKPVSYARLARDATVYYGVVDLKFANALPHPIVLWRDARLGPGHQHPRPRGRQARRGADLRHLGGRQGPRRNAVAHGPHAGGRGAQGA
jgi:vancomycin resistance protein YoaR